MKYLCDTHIFLWWLNGDRKLKTSVRNILTDAGNIIYVSAVSAWEISLKLKTNPKFKLKGITLDECFRRSGFEILDITLPHVLQFHTLPAYHHDPFDLMLVAQAKAERASLITGDEKIWRYDIPHVKA